MLSGKKRQLVSEYNISFTGKTGRNVLKDLRKKCLLMDRTLLQCNPTLDPAKTDYLEGERAVLLYIYKMLDINPYAESERAKHAINLDTEEQI